MFKQLLVGFLLADGWLEKHGQGARLGISLTERFQDVAQWYLVLLYGMGYTDRLSLGAPLGRSKPNSKPYYQLRTFSFASLLVFYEQWYRTDKTKRVKCLPDHVVLYQMLTPFVLSVWIMGDGSGMRDGGFKISTHSFTQEENQLLCDILMKKYGIYANVLPEKQYFYIRVWKRSTPLLLSLVKPYLLPSCEYKFRHVRF